MADSLSRSEKPVVRGRVVVGMSGGVEGDRRTPGYLT